MFKWRKGKNFLIIAAFVFLALLTTGAFGCADPDVDDTVVVEYQTWTESMILGNMATVLLEENTDLNIETVELESFAIEWQAMKEGEIDVFISYVGTPYMRVLGDTGLRDPDEIYDYVKQELEEQFDLITLDRIGFYNNYDLAVKPEVVEEYGLENFSDLAEVSEELVIAADVNFLDEPAAYPNLKEHYGMEFKEVKTVGITLKYPTIAACEADLVNAYTTDAQIHQLGLAILEDDKHAFPQYDTVPFVRGEVLDRHPEIADVLNALEISIEEMQELNYRLEVEEEYVEDIARDFLIQKGLIDG